MNKLEALSSRIQDIFYSIENQNKDRDEMKNIIIPIIKEFHAETFNSGYDLAMSEIIKIAETRKNA